MPKIVRYKGYEFEIDFDDEKTLIGVTAMPIDPIRGPDRNKIKGAVIWLDEDK